MDFQSSAFLIIKCQANLSPVTLNAFSHEIFSNSLLIVDRNSSSRRVTLVLP